MVSWEKIQWMIIILAVTLMLLPFAFGGFQKGVSVAILKDAQLTADEIAGIINVLQTAPPKTTYAMTLPRMDCTITIGGTSATVRIEKITHTSYFLITGTEIKENSYDCDRSSENVLSFTKGMNGEVSFHGSKK